MFSELFFLKEAGVSFNDICILKGIHNSSQKSYNFPILNKLSPINNAYSLKLMVALHFILGLSFSN